MAKDSLTIAEPPDDLRDDDWEGLRATQRNFIKKKADVLDAVIFEMLDRYGLPRDPKLLEEAGYQIVQDNTNSDVMHTVRTYRLMKVIETHAIETRIDGNVAKIIVDGGDIKL